MKCLTGLGFTLVLLFSVPSQAQFINQYTPCSTVLAYVSLPQATREPVPLDRVMLCLVEEVDELKTKIEQLEQDKENLENSVQQLESDKRTLEDSNEILEQKVTELQLQVSTLQQITQLPPSPQ